MQDIIQFCDTHGACVGGIEWALANCTNMAEVWDAIKPDWLIWVATRKGVLTERQCRLFACWCVRRVSHLLTDDRSRNAISVAERFASGEIDNTELYAASVAANDALRKWFKDGVRVPVFFPSDLGCISKLEATRAGMLEAAYAAVYVVQPDDSHRKASTVARHAARAVTWIAWSTAHRTADWYDVWLGEIVAQATYLRELPNPFERPTI